jgi:dihydroxyacetone kinase
MIVAARKGIDDTAQGVSRKGRAAWLGERTIGHPDPGATAYLRFLEALQKAWVRP